MAQLGTIRLQTQNDGIVDVPVFDTSDVEYPVLRVQTDSGVGAVNLVDPPNAELSYLRVQTAGGVKAVSDTTIYPPGWKLTSNRPGWDSDWTAAVHNEFDTDHVVGDWNDIVDIYNDNQSTWDVWKEEYFSSVGVDNHVTWDGNQKPSSSYAYFATRFDQQDTGSYAVEASINNDEMVLGRWDSNMLVLCYDSNQYTGYNA